MVSQTGPAVSEAAVDDDGTIAGASGRPTAAQLRYLRLGLSQPGGKLPLFDETGQEIPARTVRACIERGWAQPWFDNPVKPDWLVCRLTVSGREVASAGGSGR